MIKSKSISTILQRSTLTDSVCPACSSTTGNCTEHLSQNVKGKLRLEQKTSGLPPTQWMPMRATPDICSDQCSTHGRHRLLQLWPTALETIRSPTWEQAKNEVRNFATTYHFLNSLNPNQVNDWIWNRSTVKSILTLNSRTNNFTWLPTLDPQPK